MKQAVGFYANFRKGPQVAQQKLAPRSDPSPKADANDWIAMAGVIADVCRRHRLDLGLLLRWATTSDGATSTDGPLGRALADLRGGLESKGLIDPPVKPAECEDHWFVDLNTGQRMRTKRLTKTPAGDKD